VLLIPPSESVSIPTNPRTGRAVGYAFVDLQTKEEAEHAITELSGKEVLERKVSVQAARKPGAHTSGGAKEGEATGGDSRERRGRGRFGNKRKSRARGPRVIHKVSLRHSVFKANSDRTVGRKTVPLKHQSMSPVKFSHSPRQPLRYKNPT